MTANFEYYDHTADLGVIGHGDTFEQALEAVFRAVFERMADIGTVGLTQQEYLEVVDSDADLDELVVNVLSSFLSLFDTDGFLGKSATVSTTVECDRIAGLKVSLSGEPYQPAKHSINTHIKAVTYHDFQIWQDDAGWHIRILFDV